MNRHARRKAAAQARRRGHNEYYETYVKHLPQAPIGEPLERGRVHHLVFHHDDWCRFYETGNFVDCNCDVLLTRHVEPERS
jgi:hypothetical protein